MTLGLALQWPWSGRDKPGKCRGIARALSGVLTGMTAGHRLSTTCTEVPERHPDTVALLNGLGLDLGHGRR
jgi:hypothetical protein